jgi:hypothetical protein
VIKRADDRCEYCQLEQARQEATFHIDHIVPISAGGPAEADNLALACVSCSLRKGAREFIAESESGQRVRLFHPRKDVWSDHFEWHGPELIGRTATGRATIAALRLNRELIVAIREEEMLQGRHPPR